MAWYRSHYHCTDCDTDWEDEWSCCCDDECPTCGSSDWSPYDSEDLSAIVVQEHDEFIVLHSPPEVEEDRPWYREVARLSSEILAETVAIALRNSQPG